MAEIRRDLVKNKWVGIAADMALDPQEFPINKWGINTDSSGIFCPFCEGHEAFTPPEIMAVRDSDSDINGPGWSIRVIPNKFPVLRPDGILEKKNHGIYSNYNGLGRQEVIIETPRHGVDLYEYDQDRIRLIIKVLKHRYTDLSQDDRIKYIQIYKNRGIFAGASQEHSHSQIMGLPLVPHENSGVTDYYNKMGSCLLCDMVKQEKLARERLILESEHFLALCPYASRFPYEAWVIPKAHAEHFGAISEAEITELAMICKKYTSTMIDCLRNPAYNYMLNSAPVNVPYLPGFHWYLEITPRLLVTAGVDIATGMFMNPVAPELAAQLFRNHEIMRSPW